MNEQETVVAERVLGLLEPVIETAGVELVDVEWTGGTLRVVVDGEDGVSTDSLTAVNRLVSPILDQHDPIPGRYVLEVSSPGVERPLRTSAHFARALGEDVVVKLMPGSDPRRLRGALTAVDGDQVTIETVEIDGTPIAEAETHTVDLAEVERARTIFDWGPAPKPGGKGAKGSGAKKSGKNKSGQKKSGKNKSGQKKSGKNRSGQKGR